MAALVPYRQTTMTPPERRCPATCVEVAALGGGSLIARVTIRHLALAFGASTYAIDHRSVRSTGWEDH
jgi:hypothetical protein